MSDAVIAAIITGLATITAALIGLLRWRSRKHTPPGIIAGGDDPPIFTAARRFATLSTLEAQQKTIQPIEVALSNGTTILSTRQMEACAGSDWELYRIGLYLFEEYSQQPNHAARLLHVQHEFGRAMLPSYALLEDGIMSRQKAFQTTVVTTHFVSDFYSSCKWYFRTTALTADGLWR